MAFNFLQTMQLNLAPGGIAQTIHASKGDKNGWMISCTLIHEQYDVHLDASSTTAKVDGVKPSGATFSADCTITGGATSETHIVFQLTEDMTDEAGRVVCQITLHSTRNDAEQILGTSNFYLEVEDLAL